MTRNLLLPLTLLALTTTLLAADTKPAAPPPPKKGDTAKDFTLKTLDNKDLKLYDLTKNSQVVVITLRGWVTYQCPFCTKQVADFIGHAQEFENGNVQVVMIYPGPADKLTEHAREFMPKDFPKNFHFVLDPDLKFVNDWHLRWDAPKETAYPATFLVDQENKIKFAKVSKSHGDRASAAQLLAEMAR
jgi:peroxiredoxin